MAEIRRFFWLRHLRAEPSHYVIHYTGDRIVQRGRGLTFWFWPLHASVVQIPMDDRELPFLFRARSRDFQEVTVQGVITYRVVHPDTLATRVDFSIDPQTGRYLQQPLETLAQRMTQLGQQYSSSYIVNTPLSGILADGWESLRDKLRLGLTDDGILQEMGLEVVSVRVSALAPTAEVERALQTPALEAIQQQADEASFQRRALAVEKERAIQENELQNQVELARREAQLIEQQGANARREAEEDALAQQIAAEGAAKRERVRAEAQADAVERVEGARVDIERNRVGIYSELGSDMLLALAAREAAQSLPNVQYLNLSPDLLQPLLARLGSTPEGE